MDLLLSVTLIEMNFLFKKTYLGKPQWNLKVNSSFPRKVNLKRQCRSFNLFGKSFQQCIETP